jgi:hypothetical protein
MLSQRSFKWRKRVLGPRGGSFARCLLAYLEAIELGRKGAPLLDISVSEFMRLRKNE